MALITGITGAAAEPEVEVRPEPEQAVSGPETRTEPEAAKQEQAKQEPGPGFTERSYTLVGRAMRFVMQTIIPGAWQMLVQEMAEQLPANIKLEPAAEIVWENQSRHQQLIEELCDQGFVDAGTFLAASMKTKLQLLVNEAYDIRAVVYEQENGGVVVDLVTLFGDGTGVTYVNREDPGIEQSPLHPNIYLGDVPVFELLDTCLRERPQKERLPEPAAAAARIMELEYQFGARRLRGKPVNPVEIADAYLDVIAQFNAAKVESQPEPEKLANDADPEPTKPATIGWTGRHQPLQPPVERAIGLTIAKPKSDTAKADGAVRPY